MSNTILDDKGRHQTTKRELYLTLQKAAVIDTPRMRELGVKRANLQRSFVEIEQLAEQRIALEIDLELEDSLKNNMG
ncbi:MAG: hypothetical protein PF689_06470 [Deltaproteobacteria bacterium]|nr:hypothetical protein [Deltaproteobacteria bacterium]